MNLLLNIPNISALHSSIVEYVSFNSFFTSVDLPFTLMNPGPNPWDISCIKVWLKNASKVINSVCDESKTISEIGFSSCSNLASCIFLSITFLEPFALRTLSSFGKLKAKVWTPAFVSPALYISCATTIGESLPRSKFLCLSGIGRLFSNSSR